MAETLNFVGTALAAAFVLGLIVGAALLSLRP